MNAIPHMAEICRRVVSAYRKAYGNDIKAIYLYGSYARGDFDENSDIDFAAIVKGERLEVQKKRNKVLDETVRMDLEFDIITSPKVISASDFERYGEELPYYRNIKREGKLLA